MGDICVYMRLGLLGTAVYIVSFGVGRLYVVYLFLGGIAKA